jgi:hypothetical protein
MSNKNKNNSREGYVQCRTYNGVIKYSQTGKFKSLFNNRISRKSYDTAKDAARSYDMRLVDNKSLFPLNFSDKRDEYNKELKKYNFRDSKKRKRSDSDTKNVPKKTNITEYTKRTIAFSQKWKCNLCNSLLDPSFDIDHIIPHQYGGKDDKSNFHALCVRCHRYKTHSIDTRILKPILNGNHGLTSDDVLSVIKHSYENDHMSVTKKSNNISFIINKDEQIITVKY